MGGAALLTLAIAAATSALLWLGLWPLAAVGLVFQVAGRREWPTIAADVLVFGGLASHADPLWVAVLVVATVASREHDPRAILILIVAAIAATFFSLDWTILTGLLAVLRVLSLARRSLTSLRAPPRRERSQRALR